MVNPDGELDLSGSPKIEILANPGARAGTGTAKAHFTSVSGKLFPNDPAPGDIKQQQIGDCYALAAVLAILSRPGGYKAIAGLMKEVGGRVVVRFYDKGNPRYVSIEKSIRKNEEKHNGGAIWATLLEKAYAAADFVEADKRPEGKPNSKVLTGYAKINNPGHAHDVFKTLLGGDADRKSFDMGAWDPGTGLAGYTFLGMWNVDLPTDARVAAIIRDVFAGDGRQWAAFFLWRTQYVRDQWQVLLDAHGDVKDDKDTTTRRKALRLEDLADFLSRMQLDGETTTTLMTFVENNKLLPGRRGTGVYAARQVILFDRIKKALHEGKPVALASTKEVASITTGKGKSAGEAVAKGLVGSHAYAVISVREDTVAPFRKWVRVRNPWGETGREYYASPQGGNVLKARAIDAPEFDLELSDVSKRFDKMYVSGVSIAAA